MVTMQEHNLNVLWSLAEWVSQCTNHGVDSAANREDRMKIKPVAFRIGVLTTTAKPLAGQRTTLFTLKIINLE